MNNKIKKSKGFTLTELIVVIVIIGILAAVLIPTLTGYIKKANQSADEQEVAMLNKITMLWDYENDKPASVTELKAMLEEEGYTGDYSLRINGNYLWYDTDINRFLILSIDDIENLDEYSNIENTSAKDNDDYKIAINANSLEGLLVSNKKEVLLVGGKGELLEVIHQLKNLADPDEVQDPKTTLEEAVKYINELGFNKYIIDLVNNFKFYSGTNELAFNIDENLNITVGTASEKTNTVYADIYKQLNNIDLMNLFNEKLLYSVYGQVENAAGDLVDQRNIDLVNSKLYLNNNLFAAIVPNDTQNSDGSYDITIYIINEDATLLNTSDAIAVLFQLLNKYNTTTGLITPIIEGKPVAKADFVGYLKKAETIENPEINIGDNSVANSVDLYKDIAAIIVAALYYNSDYETVAPHIPNISGDLSLGSLLNNTNKFQINASVKDSVLGDYNVVYNFSFEKYEESIN